MFLIFQVSVFIFIITIQGALSQWNPDSCRNPNGVAGSCINIRQCPPLMDILQSRPLDPQDVRFLQDSKCGFEGRDPKVCCVNQQQSQRPPIPDAGLINNNNNNGNIGSRAELLPEDCGRDLTIRIVGGERAEIDEFPWMVLLEYQKPTGTTTACGGVLISKRYVVTAAHCLKGKDLPKTWRLTNVRLGEWNTDTDPDCIMDGDNSEYCAPPVVTVGVEEAIVHKDYNPQDRNQYNDIALLRLSRDVEFTTNVKPICLPKSSKLPASLWVAGWGKTESRSSSAFKLKLAIPLVEQNVCQNRYANVGLNLGNSQICAGGARGKDSCRGDSGGPLMSVDSAGKWTATGVVSFGPSPCGMEGWPGVYTKVASFTNWIVRNMRP